MKALALLCAVQFLLVLDVTIVGVALPAIRAELGFGAAGLQWVVSAYVLAFGGLLLLAGRLADVLGRRRLFAAGIAVFAAGSLACGLASSGGALIAARAFQGAGAALAGRLADVLGRRRLFAAGIAVFAAGSLACGLASSGGALIAARAYQGAGAALATPAALALVTTMFAPGPERTRALGIWTAAAPVGGAAGLLLGGVLTQALGWPWVFLVNVPAGLAALALTPRLLPADEPRAAATREALVARLDLPGAAAGTAAIVALVLALTRIEAGGYGDGVAALAVSAVAALVFARRERRAREPLLPPGTLALPPLAVALAVSLVLTAATTPTLFFITLHLQEGLGWSPTATGAGYLPVVLAVMAGALLAPRLVAAHGAAAVMAGGLALIAAGVAALTGITPDGGFATAVLPGEVLYGTGLGAGSVAATTLGTAALPAARQGLASGLLNTAAQVGTALGLAVLVAIAAIPADAVDGFRTAFAVDAAIAAAAAAAVVVCRRWRLLPARP